MKSLSTAAAVATLVASCAKMEVGTTSAFERDVIRYRMAVRQAGNLTAPLDPRFERISASEPEEQFKRAANCRVAKPGTIRGLVMGRFDDLDPPKDTVLAEVYVSLGVVGDSVEFAQPRLARRGIFMFENVPAGKHVVIEAWQPLIASDQHQLIAQGQSDSLFAGCILPSTHGMLRLSADNLRAFELIIARLDRPEDLPQR